MPRQIPQVVRWALEETEAIKANRAQKVEVSRETVGEIIKMLREFRDCRSDLLPAFRLNNDEALLFLLIHLNGKVA